MSVIAVAGPPGVGSSSVGRLLAKRLGLKFFSVGEYFKSHHEGGKETEKAVKLWKSEVGLKKQFKKLGELSELDILQIELAKKGDIVIDAKLSIRMLKGIYDFSVWLKAPLDVRARRVAKRDGISLEEAEKVLSEKESIERESWKKIYNFDFFEQEKYADIVIDASNSTPEDIVGKILTHMKQN